MTIPVLPARPRILVIGAGVLGTVYAGRLRLAGHDVTIVERSPDRRAQIERAGGLAIRKTDGSESTVVDVPVVERPSGSGYDLAIVIARKTHLQSVLELLAPTDIPSILFMMSNAAGPEPILSALGERALFGFPGAGGRLVDGIIEYQISPAFMQPTMLGEADGSESQRVRAIAHLLRSAGFHPKVTAEIDAWLKSHETFVASLGNATYIAGSGAAVAADRDLLTLNIVAIRELYDSMERAGVRVQPRWFRAWNRLPIPLIRATYGRFVGSPAWDGLGTEQLHSMRDEVEVVSEELLAFARSNGGDSPAFAELVSRRHATSADR